MNTKEKILDAALMLVAKYGTNKTSMALIAEKSGIAKASLYHYYKSKDELLSDMYHNARKK
ncbi:MAG: TetR/AcrR family transcriptional regulator [Clostridium sp.]|nr:MAG: TetR/AcrR family transcriptional regulator [Clostridium sp.]